MLTATQTSEIRHIVEKALDNAEECWRQVGEQFRKALAFEARAAVETQIPGYPFIEEGTPKVDDFICMVLDIRESTRHLMCAISSKEASVSQLQRVYYETSALLPAAAQIISYEEGNVTEYLGDGLLALFRIDAEKPVEIIRSSYRAANNSHQAVREIINPILAKRYRLPDIEIGIGLARSKAIVTLVGLKDNYLQPKAIGECVFRATKLSKGRSEIYVDEAIKNAWPCSKEGKLSFYEKLVSGVKGYRVKSEV